MTPQKNIIERVSDTKVDIGGKIVLIPKMLPGEHETIRFDEVEISLLDMCRQGTLIITTYQLILVYKNSKGQRTQIPIASLGTISKLEKVGGKRSGYLLNSQEVQLIIHRKDTHPNITVKFLNGSRDDRRLLINALMSYTFPEEYQSLFCFNNGEYANEKFSNIQWKYTYLHLKSDRNLNINGWDIFRVDRDLNRLKVDSQYWRLSDINKGFKLCKSYPTKFMVPKDLSDNQIIKVGNFRTQNRIPILSWIHPTKGSSITRCSQPRSGVNSRSSDDETALDMIRSARENKDTKLIIIDPRPIINATANRAVGAGYEKKENYLNTSVEFMGIENIHVVRQSLVSLKNICQKNTSKSDVNWHSLVESTGWLKHIKSILHATQKVIRYVHFLGLSCLIHCSDGWDRTSQVVSLAMLCMDPFYRTITGFALLIEKEWKSAGHMFKTRLGHGDKNYSDDNRSPIFLQWLDCVWQLLQQHPTSFEFNEHFLLRICEETLNCRYGTFMTDNDRESNMYDLQKRSVSLWTHVHDENHFYSYINLYYSPHTSESYRYKADKVMFPDSSMKSIRLWGTNYLRNRRILNSSIDWSINNFERERILRIKYLEDEVYRLKKELVKLAPELEQVEFKSMLGKTESSDTLTVNETEDKNLNLTGVNITQRTARNFLPLPSRTDMQFTVLGSLTDSEMTSTSGEGTSLEESNFLGEVDSNPPEETDIRNSFDELEHNMEELGLGGTTLMNESVIMDDELVGHVEDAGSNPLTEKDVHIE